ncbi:MAG: TOBE domain-containing protein, partial [Phyllobacterium sp.]
TLERGDEAARIRTTEGFTIPVGDTNAASGQQIEIGIRPEHYSLAAEGEGFPYNVTVVEPTGAETHLFGTIAGVEVRCVVRDRIAPEPGSRLPLTIDPAKVHVFDSKTGNRI